MYPHYIETTTFGVSCDAYTNLKETLTKHKTIVAEFLDKNYDRVSLDFPFFGVGRWVFGLEWEMM
jgi:calcium binding protein 39